MESADENTTRNLRTLHPRDEHGYFMVSATIQRVYVLTQMGKCATCGSEGASASEHSQKHIQLPLCQQLQFDNSVSCSHPDVQKGIQSMCESTCRTFLSSLPLNTAIGVWARAQPRPSQSKTWPPSYPLTSSWLVRSVKWKSKSSCPGAPGSTVFWIVTEASTSSPVFRRRGTCTPVVGARPKP